MPYYTFVWLDLFNYDTCPSGHISRPTLLYVDELVQERRNSSANALELRLPCTNPSMWLCMFGVSSIMCVVGICLMLAVWLPFGQQLRSGTRPRDNHILLEKSIPHTNKDHTAPQDDM